ncbi:hypothetical protein BDZ94DRAFT_1292213 [Collybia nuda]|uniref:Uncharacterized protein n=1 Tax=Collybia nuda TaxID=64659 RepID=A0A9P5XYK2_9AGAR|nr:hypothetical protein BDZ94DRAFT_1292213 [Collybia nuda]
MLVLSISLFCLRGHSIDIVPCRLSVRHFKDGIHLASFGAETDHTEESRKKPQVDLKKCEIFETPLDTIQFEGQLEDHPENDLKAVTAAVGVANAKLVHTWEKLPYTVRSIDSIAEKKLTSNEEASTGRSKKRTRVSGEDQMVTDVDEWILRNEVFLRSLSRSATLYPTWKYGLVPIKHFSTTFSMAEEVKQGGKDIASKICRPTPGSLPGYTFLHQKRADAVYIQPTLASFNTTWESMTDNCLKGLDWSHIFVAGGLVLGALLCPPIPEDHEDYPKSNHPEQWISSDIDLYIYGLTPDEANTKIAHIADIYRSNLPEKLRSSMLIVRGSQTIILYSEWPRRRVQVVLKLIGSPREVLLNFDLDICAVGYDGTEVWLVPRCARALETGFNVFTMDLINGHYLGDLFKYADKGYGIRILQSYQATLATYTTQSQTDPLTRGTLLRPPPLDLAKIAAGARHWTHEFMALALKHGHGKAKDENGVNTYRERGVRGAHIASAIPVFSHAMLEPYTQNTSEPLGRNCLTGFELLMRHVALWEEVGGRIRHRDGGVHISEVARTTYADSVEVLLSSKHDIAIPLFLSPDFMDFANDIIKTALTEHGLAPVEALQPYSNETSDSDEDGEDDPEEIMVLWRLDKILNWQMLDRQIDEVREILWAFHRANENMDPECESRVQFLKTHISKRAIRDGSAEDEMEGFLRWVGRKPHHAEVMIQVLYSLAQGSADMDLC